MANAFDLSIYILNATRSDLKLHSEIMKYSDFNRFQLDWDKEDGEKWGRILSGKKRALIFHSDLALIFVGVEFQDGLVDWSKRNLLEAIIISVGSWEEASYFISSSEARALIGWSSYQLEEKFSINDLWFHTINSW